MQVDYHPQIIKTTASNYASCDQGSLGKPIIRDTNHNPVVTPSAPGTAQRNSSSCNPNKLSYLQKLSMSQGNDEVQRISYDCNPTPVIYEPTRDTNYRITVDIPPVPESEKKPNVVISSLVSESGKKEICDRESFSKRQKKSQEKIELQSSSNTIQQPQTTENLPVSKILVQNQEYDSASLSGPSNPDNLFYQSGPANQPLMLDQRISYNLTPTNRDHYQSQGDQERSSQSQINPSVFEPIPAITPSKLIKEGSSIPSQPLQDQLRETNSYPTYENQIAFQSQHQHQFPDLAQAHTFAVPESSYPQQEALTDLTTTNQHQPQNQIPPSNQLQNHLSNEPEIPAPQFPPPEITEIQQYQLDILSARKLKLLNKIDSLADSLSEKNQAIVEKEISLTQDCDQLKRLQLENEKLASELVILRDISLTRIEEVNIDLEDVEKEEKRYLQDKQDQEDRAQEEYDEAQGLIDAQFKPQVDVKTAELEKIESTIAQSSEELHLIKERIENMKSTMKDVMMEHSVAVQKAVDQELNEEEAQLLSKCEEEEAIQTNLLQRDEELKKIIIGATANFEETKEKASKVILSLGHSREQLAIKLHGSLTQRNSLSVLLEDKNQELDSLKEDIHKFGSLYQELNTFIEQLPKYNSERAATQSEIPFGQNRPLNMIIGYGNIYARDLQDAQEDIQKLEMRLSKYNSHISEIIPKIANMKSSLHNSQQKIMGQPMNHFTVEPREAYEIEREEREGSHQNNQILDASFS